jgi:cardiolipin synthase (CMP-forming)
MAGGTGSDESKALKSAIVTVPNLLSFFRILLVPVFLWAMINKKPGEAVLIFFVAGLTDLLDGFTARIWHQRSKIGTILDPAGDKLLMTASYIVLTLPSVASPNHIPLWLTATVFLRDLLIVSGALTAFLSWRQKIFIPSLLGKISTGCQVGLVFLVLLLNYFQATHGLVLWAYLITLLLTIASGTYYFVYGLAILRQHRR